MQQKQYVSCQLEFGTGKPALKKFKQNDKAVARGLLPTLAVLGAPVGGGLAILLATLFVSPSLVTPRRRDGGAARGEAR